MQDMTTLGQAGLQGWRAKVGDQVAPAVAKRSGLSEDQVRAALGAAFLVLSILYVVKTLSEMSRGMRAG